MIPPGANGAEALLEPKRRTETPLPWRQLGILLLLNLAEPMSASIIYPFIAQLIHELGVAEDKSSIGYYVGMVESLFYLTEAVCILQWGRLSDRIGRKPVLITGLLGLTISLTSFGLSHSLIAVIISRALAGALNGNIGVLKTAIGELADDSNIARAFSFLPLVWFVGSTVAPLIGGYLSHPAESFPYLFQQQFWRENPYFLPCGMAAAFSLSCCIVAVLFLKETKSDAQSSKIKLAPMGEDQVEMGLLESAEPPFEPQVPLPSNDSPPIRLLLTKPVLLAVLNYGLLALLEISFLVLLPIFLASSLHFAPSSIGLVMGITGLVNGVIQIAFFVPLHKRIGSRNLFTLGVCSVGFMFCTFPFIANSYTRNSGALGLSGYALLAFQMALCPLLYMAFNVIIIYVQASPSSKSTLGATNGIAQTAGSVARAIGPASVTSLFSLSLQRQDIAGGNLVYYVLAVLTVACVGFSRMLPAEPWRRSTEHDPGSG